jgi:hypothetical protein
MISAIITDSYEESGHFNQLVNLLDFHLKDFSERSLKILETELKRSEDF